VDEYYDEECLVSYDGFEPDPVAPTTGTAKNNKKTIFVNDTIEPEPLLQNLKREWAPLKKKTS
jgi:hypothetical protein